MNKAITICFQDIYKKNLALLDMVREERWEEFVGQAEYYVLMLHDVFDNKVQDLDPEVKASLRTLVEKIQENEKEMTEKLSGRLSFLRDNMSRLHHGNKCSQLYNIQFMSVKSNYN
ncbi:flagellar protein FliT [Serratia fonticola]|uniref:flagellar protein FliT n=1 Tax=Serratia fonticola TaxID=47917 RepID=UPI0004669480|nr:flagellar protein FliT [Serratia fonticola]